MLRVLSGILLSLVTAGPLAAGPTSPSAADIAAARKRSQGAVQASQALRQEQAFQRELQAKLRATQGAARAPSPGPLRLDVPDAADPSPVDLRALLGEGDVAIPGVASPIPELTGPLVFISFSLPRSSLRQLLPEAEATGATLVLRGLVQDSLPRTVERVAELLEVESGHTDPAHDEEAPGLVIDPTLYQRFAVEHVPSFVLPLAPVPRCTPAGCPAPEHVKLAGDVTLAYALERIAGAADSATARTRAQSLLQRLVGEP